MPTSAFPQFIVLLIHGKWINNQKGRMEVFFLPPASNPQIAMAAPYVSQENLIISDVVATLPEKEPF